MRVVACKGFIIAALLVGMGQTASLTFHPPVLVGPKIEYADHGFGVGLAPFTTLVLEGEGVIYQSTDSGRSWEPMEAGTPGISGKLHASATQAGAWMDYGNVTDVSDKSGQFTSFNGSGLHTWTVGPDGKPAVTTDSSSRVVFRGLPRPATCYGTTFGGCPFRLSGGSVVTLPGSNPPRLVYSAIVKYVLGPGADANKYATSIVAFGSDDNGFTWDYLADIAKASEYPGSQEGPNENDLVVLPNNTLLAMMRWDAGDGPISHPYVNYHTSTSGDGGKTWSPAVPMADAGCARPKLHLTQASTFLAGPLLLSGGRHRNANITDVSLWLDGTGSGSGPWTEYSVSYWHNLLTPNASWAFTPFVNSTKEPRETTSYTSMTPVYRTVDSEDVVLTYNRKLPGQSLTLGFAMKVTVSW